MTIGRPSWQPSAWSVATTLHLTGRSTFRIEPPANGLVSLSLNGSLFRFSSLEVVQGFAQAWDRAAPSALALPPRQRRDAPRLSRTTAILHSFLEPPDAHHELVDGQPRRIDLHMESLTWKVYDQIAFTEMRCLGQELVRHGERLWGLQQSMTQSPNNKIGIA